MEHKLKAIASQIQKIPDYNVSGYVTAIKGLLIEATGIHKFVSIGSRCVIEARDGHQVICEVVGVNGITILLMAFQALEGIGVGCKITLIESQSTISPDISWMGRVINAMGEPVDGKGALVAGNIPYPIKASPPPAHTRRRVEHKLDVGVRAVNAFLTCCTGQRMGIFAGSGIGKSMLIAMLTRYSEAEIKVIGLVGERGREVQEFVEDYLGEDGMKNAVIIVATSDEAPLMRRQAAYLTMAVAEYFRDLNKEVLCLMDSVTRFAMAQREIGLSAGEPPTSKGYTPSVFAEMPKLLERAGPGKDGHGNITGLFSVLVEGDDTNEPISDTVRGILDGHIVLNRKIAERGRFPAIDILKSISRTMPGCNTGGQNAIVTRAKALLSTYEDMAEMIRLGAYRKGSNAAVDEAIAYYPKLEAFLSQDINEPHTLEQSYHELAEILGMVDILNAAPEKVES